MKKQDWRNLRQLSLLLLLTTKLWIVCGQVSGQSKTPSLTDTTLILNRPPKRLIYEQEKGVFLNELQEQVTLEKLLWKEVYRQDAVAMYWVNIALEERVADVIAKNKRLDHDLALAETKAIQATAGMEHYRTLFKEAESTNKTLRDSNSDLRVSKKFYQGTTILLGISTFYFGFKTVFN